VVHGDPNLLLRLKRIFARIGTRQFGAITLSNTADTCADLLWVMQRYPLEVAPEDLAYLNERADKHRAAMDLAANIMAPGYVPGPVEMAEPPRHYQQVAADLWAARKRLLLGDDIGLGKTVSAIAGLVRPEMRPAVVVCQAGAMPGQWQAFLKRFAPQLRVHVAKKGTPYELPRFLGAGPDVLVLTYHKLAGWADHLKAHTKAVVYDEVQELRHNGTAKYDAAKSLNSVVPNVLGMTATPVYNYGIEGFNVVDALAPDILGTRFEFINEWCDSQGRIVREPEALGHYLREQCIMLRRTRKEVGRETPGVEQIPYPIDADAAVLNHVKGQAARLAEIILANSARKGVDLSKAEALENMQVAGELDRLLRQATGIAKAPFIAAFLAMLVENGERVLVGLWHREVYAILNERLAHLKPAMFTGSETSAQKAAEKERFVAGETPLMFISLRSGAGLDGLQHHATCVVSGELDWSPKVHEQLTGRVDRDGREATTPVPHFWLVSEVGSDPTIAEVHGIKAAQATGIMNPGQPGFVQATADPHRVRKLAEAVLGRSAPSPEIEDGKLF
jgi:SNF2 family DNA or RNA helicase